MAVTFTPVVNPALPLAEDRAPKMRKLPYGDGYTGRQPDGINNDLESPQLKWENLSREEYKSIKAFLEAYAKTGEAFLYAVPWTNDGDDVAKLYFCETWSRNRPEAGAWELTAQLREVKEAA